MTKISRSFIIRFYNDEHGMKGTFPSVQEAVDHINEYYRDSKALGVDCKGGRWIVVCEDRTRITNGGAFVREEICRTVVAKVHYSAAAGEFISEEVGLQSAT